MDIYIVRKCKIEMKEFATSDGTKYSLPVMTKADVHSYVVTKTLNSWQKEKFQNDLEYFYTKGEQK
jgi:hypothetical protein